MLMLGAVAGTMIRPRLVWWGESLKPKFSKVSPGAGFKRMFGKQALANFAKGLFKVVALGAVMTAVLWPEGHRLGTFHPFQPAADISATTGLPVEPMMPSGAMSAAARDRG